jgi:hypothetical protein
MVAHFQVLVFIDIELIEAVSLHCMSVRAVHKSGENSTILSGLNT